MNSSPRPDVGDDLDRALFQLKRLWFGLFSGAVVLTALAIALITSREGPVTDLGEASYLFLLPVPLGLLAVYLLVPVLTPKEVGTLAQLLSSRRRNPLPGWDRTTPADAYYWYPLYLWRHIARSSLFEAAGIITLLGFFISGNWVLLGGALVLVAALALQVPTRSAVVSFADAAREREAT